MADAALVEDVSAETAGKDGTATTTVAKETAASKDTAAAAAGKKDGGSLATGADTPDTGGPKTWPDDWRQKMAAETGGTDAKAVAKELKRLERYASPNAIWAKAAELEAKLGAGGLVKIPGPKATDEEKAAYLKAIGVPETVEEYGKTLKLANGRVLGDADKPVFDSFAKALHPAGATPAIVNAATDWWLDFQQQVADQQAEKDDGFRRQSAAELQKDWGAAYKPTTAAISLMLADAPEQVRDYFAGGRAGDGRKMGDDPVVLKWLGTTAMALGYDAAQNYGDAGSKGSSRLEEIRKFARDKPDDFEADKKMQAEQLELIEAEQRSGRRAKR